MAYSTGTTDSRENLLDLFRAFSILAGWSVNRFAASGTGYNLNISKTGKYSDVLFANLRSVNDEDLPGNMGKRVGIVCSMSDSYDSAKDCVDQPGAPVRTTNATDYYATSIHPFTAIAKYWFFSGTNPEFLAMVLLLPNGEYRHLVIGEVEKYDLTLGKGAFMFGTNGNSATYGLVLPFETATGTTQLTGSSWLRLVADERDGWWTPCLKDSGNSAFSSDGYAVGSKFRNSILMYNSMNQFSNASALVPVEIFARKQAGRFFPVGYVPQWRVARREAFIVDQVYPLGTDNWMGFPAVSISQDYSLIYKRID